MERGEPGRLYAKQGVSRLKPWVSARGCVTVFRASLGGKCQPSRPVHCWHLPFRKGLIGHFLRSTPAARIQWALLPSPLHPISSHLCSPAEIPGARFVAAAFGAQCELPAPQTHCSRGNAHSRTGQKSTLCQGLRVWDRPKQGTQDMSNESVAREAAALPLGAGSSLS